MTARNFIFDAEVAYNVTRGLTFILGAQNLSTSIPMRIWAAPPAPATATASTRRLVSTAASGMAA